jgi:hypothetical protein
VMVRNKEMVLVLLFVAVVIVLLISSAAVRILVRDYR